MAGSGNSLSVRRLGLSAFTIVAWVQSLVGVTKVIPQAAQFGQKKRKENVGMSSQNLAPQMGKGSP